MRSTFFLLSAAFAACTPPITYEQHIRPLLGERCVSCHQPGGIGPFSLTSYQDAVTFKDAIKKSVEARTMPPYLAGPDCNTYSDDLRLSDEQIAQVGKWVSDGTPRGTPVDAGAPSVVPTSLPRVDALLKMPQVYVPTHTPDDYRCFIVDFPASADTYVTGFNILPGNRRTVHHVIAYLLKPDQIATNQALDDAEAGPGYTCFGGPGGSNIDTGWLGSWAPGSIPVMYPEGTGLFVTKGSKVVLQVHYNTGAVSESERSDQTTIELAMAPTVAKRAYLMPWSNIDWLNGAMRIPANMSKVEHRYGDDPSTYLNFLSDGKVTGREGFRIHSAAMHQHLLGTKSRIEVRRPDGSKTCLLDIPRWDFHWQRAYDLAEPVVFHPGESLFLSCTWDNSAEHQPVINGTQAAPHDVNWGENTTDEMCLGIVFVSEL